VLVIFHQFQVSTCPQKHFKSYIVGFFRNIYKIHESFNQFILKAIIKENSEINNSLNKNKMVNLKNNNF